MMTRAPFLSVACAALALLALSACGGGARPAGTTSTNAPAGAIPTGPTSLPPPETLIGMNGPALERALGAPGFRRIDPPAEIWQYAGTACVAHLFLYVDAADTPAAVRHMVARGRDGGIIDMATCLDDIAAARVAAGS